MGIFTRFRDIISSNINAMLDRAEDPEKLIKLMIREMEDTLVEIKAACAGVMAESKKIQRECEQLDSRANYWQDKAEIAVAKGRDDLAREALIEKRRYDRRGQKLESDMHEHKDLINQYQNDIQQLEEKLNAARDKQRMLVQRHIHARRKMRAQREIRRVDGSEAMLKFEGLEQRIDRMESEAELVNFGKKTSLEQEFDKLGANEDIEKELKALKTAKSKGAQSSTSPTDK
ncbi:MAG: phage shock protein PspA [Desulfobacterales bacterium]|nr:phage shock protein PspA [Desulfobacterales bacterium]